MQTDVVIVGAGPSGATLAYLLAKSGVDVTLIESEKSLDREFRGPAYQPACIRMWDEMGILPDIEKLEHHKIENFSLFKNGERKMCINLKKLPPPYNFVYLMQQGPLLRLMIKLASQYENFNYIGNASVYALQGKGQGVKFLIGGEEKSITARLIVAADGRFSKIRSLSSIDLENEKQPLDILWFDIPSPGENILDAGLRMINDGLIIMLPKEGNHIQVGWILKKGGYEELRQKGIKHIKEQTILAEPRLKEVIESHITSFDQCHLLDIKVAKALKWAQDGILLIGDAAHIASPVGAQGNKLAIEDAAVAHPIIVEALKKEPGIISEKTLKQFYNRRIKDVKLTQKMQKKMSKALLEVNSSFGKWLRDALLPILPYTPMGKRARKVLALGNTPIKIAKEAFQKNNFLSCYVTRIERQTESAITIYFKPPKDFVYRSGQFIILRFLLNGGLYRRAYSLTSAPGIDNECSFTVKKIKDGLISQALYSSLKVGDLLTLSSPSGNFTLPKGAQPRHYCMIVAGSGITPCYSLIKTILKYSPESTISLLDINHSKEDILFRAELEALQGKSFAISHHLTKEKGRPTTQTFEDFIRDSKMHQHDPIYYICGPDPIKKMAEGVLEGHHTMSNLIYIEHFASLSEPYEELFRKAEQLGAIEVGIMANQKSPQTFTASLKTKEYSVPYIEGKSLLDSCLEVGLEAPYSCKEGICRSCKAKLRKGRVALRSAKALSPAELKEGYILTCQAKPLCDDISIKYE